MNQKTLNEISSELNQIVGYSELVKCITPECTLRCEQIRNSVYRIDALMARVERRKSSDQYTSYTKDKTVSVGSLIKGKNIMIVDDIVDNQNMLEHIFSLFSCNIQCAINGEEALKLYEIFKPDIVCMDIVMPGIEGDEVALSLKKIGCEAKFIAVSGLKKYSSEQIAIFDAWLPKPFTIDQLLDVINECYLEEVEPEGAEVVKLVDLSDIDKDRIMKSAKNGAISELELIVDALEDTKSKEFLKTQLSKMNLNTIMMSLQ